MTSNYPPGVTGLEPEIIGDDGEWVHYDDDLACESCGQWSHIVGDGYVIDDGDRVETREWTCPRCGEPNDTETRTSWDEEGL